MINKLTAIILLCLVSPILILVSFFIVIVDGFPIIYKQKRSGQNNSFFTIYKLRTMKKNTPELATDKLNITSFYCGGTLIRKLSIDELPQFINIIKGDINFFGPRPALHNQFNLINQRNKLGISLIKPGITGWAQVNGRDNITEKEKIELDYYYLKNKSFKLNCIILIKTIFKVIMFKDIN